MQDINICLISVGHGGWRWEWGWDVLLFSVCWKFIKIQNVEEEKKRPETKWPGKYNPQKMASEKSRGKMGVTQHCRVSCCPWD